MALSASYLLYVTDPLIAAVNGRHETESEAKVTQSNTISWSNRVDLLEKSKVPIS
jgi:hypothetical protein